VRVAKYHQIADAIRAQIQAGDLPANGRLPAETAIAADHNASVPTVRQAMGILRAEGLIESRHGVGTFVRAEPDHAGDGQENSMQRVLRWEVPVDDEWHEIGAGRVVEVAVRNTRRTFNQRDVVEVWTLENTPDVSTEDLVKRSAMIVGTGQPAPENTEYLGTAIVPLFTMEQFSVRSVAGLVWHVFGRTP
jgi:DNA-binding transcriptional regulator YhcF (GntR family)